MKRLFAFELKKILRGRALWVAFALCVAVQLLNQYGIVRLALGGAAGGMREVYARYDGLVVTEEAKVNLLSDYREYAAAHPDEFKPSVMDIGYWALDGQVWQRRHGYGVMLAYQNLLALDTRESLRDAWQKARNELVNGKNAQGDPLNPGMRRWYERLTAQPPHVPAVRNDLGWTIGFESPVDSVMQRAGVQLAGVSPLGILLMLLLLLAGLPGYEGERNARLEPVLLTSRRRKPAALAKLLAVMTAIAAAVLAMRLLELALRSAALGLKGWDQPSGPYGLGASHLAAWSVATVGLLLACAAGAALITALSALARGGVAALGLAGAVLAAQAGICALGETVYLGGPQDGWTAWLHDAASALPLNVVNNQGIPYGLSPFASQVLLLLALPLALCAACLWLAPRIYLRKRRV